MTTSPCPSRSRTPMTVKDSLSTTSLPRSIWPGSSAGVQGDAHLATRGEDVDGAVVVEVDKGAVDRRRLGQLLDFVAQRRDLVAGLLDRDGELLVVRAALGQLTPGLEELLFEHLDAPVGLVDVAEREVARRAARRLARRSLVRRLGVESLRTVHDVTLGERARDLRSHGSSTCPLEYHDTNRPWRTG